MEIFSDKTIPRFSHRLLAFTPNFSQINCIIQVSQIPQKGDDPDRKGNTGRFLGNFHRRIFREDVCCSQAVNTDAASDMTAW